MSLAAVDSNPAFGAADWTRVLDSVTVRWPGHVTMVTMVMVTGSARLVRRFKWQ